MNRNCAPLVFDDRRSRRRVFASACFRYRVVQRVDQVTGTGHKMLPPPRRGTRFRPVRKQTSNRLETRQVAGRVFGEQGVRVGVAGQKLMSTQRTASCVALRDFFNVSLGLAQWQLWQSVGRPSPQLPV